MEISDDLWVGIFFFILLLALFLFWIWIPGRMASNRNRSVLGWIILGFFISPIWTIIILACIGKAND